MHVLITGGAGFIGSHLVDHHLSLGDSVQAVDDLSTGKLENIEPFQAHPSFQFKHCDLLVWDGLEEAAGWADRIYHLAAVVGVYLVLKEPVKVMATNVAGTERVLRALRSSGHRAQVLIASSSEVYGPSNDGALREDATLQLPASGSGRWNYAISKLADEAFGLSYAREFDLHVTVARIFNVIGPRQSARYGMVTPRFVGQALREEPLTVFGDGRQSRCFCDVRDTVVAFDRLLSNPDSVAQIVNVGSDRECTILELAELVQRKAGSRSPIQMISYEEAYGDREFYDFRRRVPALEKLRALTDLEPRHTLEDTVDQLIAIRREKTKRVAAV